MVVSMVLKLYSMKKIISLVIVTMFCSLFSAQINPPKRKVQLVILFDTSNSMDGLITQAKSRIWAIVNEASGLKYFGETPSLEIAMYDYGNDGLSASTNYIRQQTPFTTNLDVISEKLFSLKTNGGSEFCGAVIQKSLNDLSWSNNPADLKLIYIAGNEPFNQGPINYKEVCSQATSKGVFVNTIYCGDALQGIREFWKDGATCSKGEYFNINSNQKVAYIETPYDDQINEQNIRLNGTYIGYGSTSSYNLSNQVAQDMNAAVQSKAVVSERILVKSKKSAYKNGDWDAVDAMEADSTFLEKVKEDDLPKELKGKSKEEQEKYIKEKSEERDKIQAEIGRLGKEREQYIQEELKKRNESEKQDDFGTAVAKSLKEKAKSLGYE
jgi:hypothetical protein